MTPEHPASTGREPPSPASRFLRRGLVPLSVVLTVRGRPSLLWETLAACQRNAGPCQLEFIVVHDGALEAAGGQLRETLAGRPNLSGRLIANRETGDGRNPAVEAARYSHVLFLDEDLQPANDDFFQVHASLHSSSPERHFAVLGDVIWEEGPREIVFSLGRFLGSAGQLGRTAPPAPRTFLDHRYFSASNVSIKKSLVRNWVADGFWSDLPPGLADLELAYRLSKHRFSGLKIFYDPAALASRRRKYTLGELLERQLWAGKLLKRILDRHPATALEFGLQPYLDALHCASNNQPEGRRADYQAIFEGIKAWARIEDALGESGAGFWRSRFLFPVLEACLLQGFEAACSQGFVHGGAGALILERFLRSLRQVLHDRVPELA